MELVNNIAEAHVRVSVFGGVGERTREGNELYDKMKKFKVTNADKLIDYGKPSQQRAELVLKNLPRKMIMSR